MHNEERSKAWRIGLAAEAVANFPVARKLLESRQLSVTALVAVKYALTGENHEELLHRAIGLTEAEAAVLASQYRPKPPRSDSIRPVTILLPALVSAPAGATASSSRPANGADVSPSAPRFELVLEQRFEISTRVTPEVHAQFEAVKAALSHKVPNGNINDILGECFRITLEVCERRKIGAQPRTEHSTPSAMSSPATDDGNAAAKQFAEPRAAAPVLSLSSERDSNSAAVDPALSVSSEPESTARTTDPLLSPSIERHSSSAAVDPVLSLSIDRQFPPHRSDPVLSLSSDRQFPPHRSDPVLSLSSDHQSPRHAARRNEPDLSNGLPPPPPTSFEAFDAELDGRSRLVSVLVRRTVWERDKGRCSFRGTDGHVCGSRYQLEFDHWKAFSLGGEHTVANVRILCSAHNRYEAERVLGARLMRKYFRRAA
jgi:hypothetical protein